MTVADQPAALLSGLERATVPALDEWLQEPPL
jgi:hypothetical protein